MSQFGWGWGPVFEAERVTRARRWQGYAIRAAFVGVLLLGLVLVWSRQARETGPVTVAQMAEVGAAAYAILTRLLLIATLAIAPATAAGAICLDRSRGMLAHVFVTDLSNREIILGKLAARLLPVWGLLACSLPVATLATLLGGIDPEALIGAYLIVAGLAFLGCALALMLSVWASKPQEVLFVVFSVWAVWMLALPVIDLLFHTPGPPVPFWLELTNPFTLAQLPYRRPDSTTLLEPILFALACLIVGSICVVVAIRQVRVAGTRSVRPRAPRPARDRVIRSRGNWRIPNWPGPSLDANPVGWREWHRSRPSRWVRWIWIGFSTVSGLAGLAMILTVSRQAAGPRQEIPGLAVAALTTLGLLLVSASTASVLAEERARGSLDVLLTTPISTRSILRAKWLGAFRPVLGMAVWPVVLSGVWIVARHPVSGQVGIFLGVPILIVTQGAFLVSLGLALATWIKRTGQATAWTVAVYVVAVVGWPIVGIYLPLSSESYNTMESVIWFWLVAMGSPFYNTGLSLAVALTNDNSAIGAEQTQQGICILLLIWTLGYGLAAWLLFEATVGTFDRCLGRMPERTRRVSLTNSGSRTLAREGRPVDRGGRIAPPPR